MRGILAALLFSAVSIRVLADNVTIPNAAENSAAPGAQIPFDLSGNRYLNIYNSSEFLGAMPNGGRITAIAFRLDEAEQQGFTAHIPDLELRLSTSPSAAPVIPLPFASNIGADETTVFRGAVDASLQATGARNPFDLVVPFNRPFDYDPRKGSLAVDLWTYQGPSDQTIRVDAGGPGGGAIFGSIGDAQAIVGLPQLVIQLQFTAVPEPAALALLGTAGMMLALKRFL